MDTLLLATSGPRKRRSHTAEFKAQVVAACRHPGVSIAAVALANQLNANQLRRWVKENRDQHRGVPTKKATSRRTLAPVGTAARLVPISVQPTMSPSSGEIRIVVQRPEATVEVTWPSAEAGACAVLLRELLR